MNQTLVHSFPIIGRIEVPLHAESQQIFDLLAHLPMSGPRHLQSLDHLGELRSVLKCGHHSRYEYLLLQIYLIHFFKERARGFGLSSKIQISPTLEISSGEELLKCWAFLEEFGHLRGTYEAERFLLRALSTHANLRTMIIAAFSDARAKQFVEKLIQEEDLWSLHRAIAWLALDTYRSMTKYQRQKPAIELAIELTSALVSPVDNEAIIRARNYFSRIRRLAHIYLDLTNLPTYVQFHPAVLLQQISENANAFLEDDGNPANRLVSSILDYLQEEIYASAQANKYKLDRVDGLTERLEKSLSNQAKSPAKSQPKFVNWIIAAKGGEFWGYRSPRIEREHRLRLRFVSDGYFGPDGVRPFTEAARFQRTVRSQRWSVIITNYNGPSGENCFLDLYEIPNHGKFVQGRVAKALLNFIRSCYASHYRLPTVFAWISDEATSDLFRYLLSRAVPAAHRFRFDERGSFSDHAINIIDQKTKRGVWSKNIAWEAKRLKLSTARKWEIECLRREVREALVGSVLIATRNIIVEGKNHKALAEFDGVFIRLNKGLAEVRLIEAKSAHKGGSSDAKKALEEKLRRLNLDPAIAQVESKEKYAAVSLII